jgi:GNAT superfamily N-acetyltransferase
MKPTLQTLNSITAMPYQRLTFPSYRDRLYNLTPTTTLAIGAMVDEQAIGLALAEMLPDGRSATVLSIFVDSCYRDRGIGTALLARLEQELQHRGCAELELVYVTGKPSTAALERLLHRCGWDEPQPRMIICKSTTDRIAAAPWMQKTHLPASFQIVPWTEITAGDRAWIQQQQLDDPWIPPDLVPFQLEENFEPINSLGLRYHGQIVGWVITHRLDPNTIRYTCSFVREDLQRMGRIVPMYVAAIQRQHQAGIKQGIWTVPLRHTAMYTFVQQRMADYMTSIEETRGVSKPLAVYALK